MLKYLKSEINVFISIYMKPSSLPLTWNTRLTNLVLVVQLNNNNNIFSEGIRQAFGAVGAVCFKEESSGHQKMMSQ